MNQEQYFELILNQLYKIKNKSQETNTSVLLVTLENESLSDMSTAFCLLLSIFGHTALISKVRRTDIRSLGLYPNYLYLDLLQYGAALIFCFSMSLMYYVQKKDLRTTIWRKIKEIISKQSSYFFKFKV